MREICTSGSTRGPCATFSRRSRSYSTGPIKSFTCIIAAGYFFRATRMHTDKAKHDVRAGLTKKLLAYGVRSGSCRLLENL